MSRRELTLLGVIILLLGLLGGFAIAQLGGDDDPTTETDASTGSTTTSTTTSQAPESTTTTTTTTSTTSTTTSTTTTTSTSTTTTTMPAPVVQVVASVVTGEVMGVAPDSHFDDVEFAMVEVFGAPDSDTGWIEGCPFDGLGDNERSMTWAGLRLDFRNDDGTPRYDGWSWRPGNPIPEGELPTDPQPDEWVIELHPGVTPDQTIAEVGAVTGFGTTDYLGFALVVDPDLWEFAYLSPDGEDAPVFEITSRLRFCD